MKVLRACARSADLIGTGLNLIGEVRRCTLCDHNVHYDPRASIPDLGEELIVCLRCLDRVVEILEISGTLMPDDVVEALRTQREGRFSG